GFRRRRHPRRVGKNPRPESERCERRESAHPLWLHKPGALSQQPGPAAAALTHSAAQIPPRSKDFLPSAVILLGRYLCRDVKSNTQAGGELSRHALSYLGVFRFLSHRLPGFPAGPQEQPAHEHLVDARLVHLLRLVESLADPAALWHLGHRLLDGAAHG